MSVWLRFAAASALALAAALAAPAPARANPQRAEALNTEGKELFRNEDYEAALERFVSAVELSPDPRFHFNVCFTFYMLGDLQAASDACGEVQPPEADDELIAKRDHVMGLVEEEMAEQPDPPPPPPGDGDPGQPGGGGQTGGGQTGGGQTGGGQTGGGQTGDGGYAGDQSGGTQAGYESGSGQYPRRRRPPPLPGQVEIPHDYNWSLGAQLGPLRNFGLGGDNYQDVGFHVRLLARFVISPRHRLGIETYGNISRFALADQATVSPLRVGDLGGALFQHIPLLDGLYFTPLAGAHLSIQQPETSNLAFATFGLRGEASLNYVFGADDQHAVTVTPVGVNLYLPASGAGSDLAPAEYGLDGGSATYTFTVGYTMRFAEPFAGSLITLE